MSEDASRQTRSQKRALDRDSLSVGVDTKRLRLDAVLRSRSETSGLLSGGEVKATIKLEVQTGEQPVDMSTSKTDVRTEHSLSSADDVIILSDNDTSSPHMNGKNHFKELDTQLLVGSSSQEREHVIKQLTEELRVEETKLILLKKLRQGQIQKDSNTQKPQGSEPSPPVRTSTQHVTSGRASGTAILPALVCGAGQISKHGSQIIMPQLVRGAQPISVTMQQVTGLRAQQQNSTSASPLLLTTRTTVPNIQNHKFIQNHKIIQPGLIRVANAPNGGLLLSISQSTAANLKPAAATSQSSVSNVTDSPASRQAAAKLALRKQLEKTLLEIPPPQPPAAEVNFLPSAANNEFIYLLGLEEVVQNLLDSLGRGKQGVYGGLVVSDQGPFCCGQCKTDFTCRWRKDKGGAVMCEQCMSSNQKKAVKAEHTDRLKAAFVKALQQEQEILQQAPVSSSSSSSSAIRMKTDQTKQHSSPSVQQTHSRSSQPINRNPAIIKQNAVQLSRSVQPSVTAVHRVPHSFSPSSQLQNAVAAAALVSRPGKHAARQGSKVSSSARKSDPTTSSYRKQINVTSGVTMAYVNPSLSVQKSSSSSVERQREYLLDMIPSRSVSQTANAWK